MKSPPARGGQEGWAGPSGQDPRPARRRSLRSPSRTAGRTGRWIEEALDGSKRNDQLLRNVVEGKFDFEFILANGKVPVLVLEHDGHFVGISLRSRSETWTPGYSVESDEEMMLARQAGSLDASQRLPHHPAQSVLRQEVISHQIFRHHYPPLWIKPHIQGLRVCHRAQLVREKCRLLLPGACEPRLSRLRPRTLISATRTALSSESNRSIVVVGNYMFGPITAVPSRAKAHPLRPRRSYFAPIRGRAI